MHNRRQLRKDIAVRLRGIRVLPQSDLDHRQPEGPYIRGDCVCPEVVLRLAFYALRLWGVSGGSRKWVERGTYGHVTLTSDIGFG